MLSDNELAAARSAVRELEQKLTVAAHICGDAMVRTSHMRQWHAKYEESREQHPQKWQSLESLEEKENLARAEFSRISKQLAAARQTVIDHEREVSALALHPAFGSGED
jgi:DNA repair ATPase RecN